MSSLGYYLVFVTKTTYSSSLCSLKVGCLLNSVGGFSQCHPHTKPVKEALPPFCTMRSLTRGMIDWLIQEFKAMVALHCEPRQADSGV